LTSTSNQPAICADNALLLSDVHLSAAQADITARFLHCLKHQLQGVDQLFILGDLFEFWIGDDAADALADRVSASLACIAGSGVQIYFMHGNRDFLIGEQYAAAAGMQLLPDPTIVDSGGQRMLLAHGDAWCIDDHAYQALRQQVRDPAWQAEFLALPATQRYAMAQQARDASRTHTSQARMEIMDVNAATGAQVFQDYEVDCMVHGHTHRPADHNHQGCMRHVLGDWYQHSSWLRLHHGSLNRHGSLMTDG
jgi:UDP-2,3-diacylglucosamine hydrolase